MDQGNRPVAVSIQTPHDRAMAVAIADAVRRGGQPAKLLECAKSLVEALRAARLLRAGRLIHCAAGSYREINLAPARTFQDFHGLQGLPGLDGIRGLCGIH